MTLVTVTLLTCVKLSDICISGQSTGARAAPWSWRLCTRRAGQGCGGDNDDDDDDDDGAAADDAVEYGEDADLMTTTMVMLMMLMMLMMRR